MTTAPSRASAWLSLAVLLAAVAVGLYSPLPKAAGEDAPLDTFSATRALAHLEVIAKEPHVAGTAANARVRDYLVAEVEKHGLEVQRQAGTWSHGWHDPVEGPLENILARRRGTREGHTVALVAHHDSTPFDGDDTGPSLGAADDGSAVAAMLEVLRILDEEPPLKNDLLFVITDAEELGLHGARVFQDHPWCEEIDVVFNFEARGASGANLMFQTSPRNRWLVSEWAKAVPDPIGASVMADVYRRMPNDTDFTMFLAHGFAGLNFAFVGDYEAYHTSKDRIENLDLDTFQHQGETMLGLARHFGNLDVVGKQATSDLVYFNPLGAWFVSYPVIWNWIQLVGAGVLLLAGIVLSLRRRAMTGAALLRGLLAQCVAVALAPITAIVISHGALRAAGDERGFTDSDPAFFLAIALAGAANVFLVQLVLARKDPLVPATIAVGIGWWVVLLLSCLYLPGGSYLASWPCLALGLAALHGGLFPAAEGRTRFLLVVLSALPLPYLVATYWLFEQGLMLYGAAAPLPLLALALAPWWHLLRPLGKAVVLVPLGGAVVACGVGFVLAT